MNANAVTHCDRETHFATIPPRIPPFYVPASLRNVTPWDGGRVGVGLEAEDGAVIRFRLTASDAAALVRLLRSR